MKKIKKIMLVIQRKIICFVNYISPRKYMTLYSSYLKKIGVNIKGKPNYIDPTVHFDGIDYGLISIGDHTVISKEVLLLTHDYSIFRALKTIDREGEGQRILKPIRIGDNCFIGARATLLPGTIVSDNVIVGAGTVVTGYIPPGIVIVGNPAKKIKETTEYAREWIELMEK